MIFGGTPPSLFAKARSARGDLDSARQAAYKVEPKSKRADEFIVYKRSDLPNWYAKWELRERNAENGVLYVLSHKLMPGILKIGFTEKPLQESVRRQSALIPLPEKFKVEAKWINPDGNLVLKEVRKVLKQKHSTSRLSFFRISVPKCRKIIDAKIKNFRIHAA